MRFDIYELQYLPLFYEELDNAISYIAFRLQNPEAANDLLDKVDAAIQNRLKIGPENFEPVFSKKERDHKYYRIYVKNYVIYYVVIHTETKSIMEVRRFLHTLENREVKL